MLFLRLGLPLSDLDEESTEFDLESVVTDELGDSGCDVICLEFTDQSLTALLNEGLLLLLVVVALGVCGLLDKLFGLSVE